jgi:hypothetical protein
MIGGSILNALEFAFGAIGTADDSVSLAIWGRRCTKQNRAIAFAWRVGFAPRQFSPLAMPRQERVERLLNR